MKLRQVIVGLGAAAVVAALGLLLFGGGSHGYELHAELADADGLLAGSRVEIGGVGVGSVQSLKITPDDHALVTFTVNPQAAPIGRDATVVVRPADLLGEKYIDLTTGNRREPARSGYTIPAGQTQEATDFDQIIDVLAPTERDRLAILVHETGVALFGRGADVAKLLSALPPSLSDAQSLISQVTASNQQLTGLIDHASGVMAALTAHQTALTHFVSTAAGALSATAAHAGGLAQTVAGAPGLLTQLDRTLVSLDSAGAKLRPAARGLETTAPALTETLKELPGFTAAARPTLAEVASISPQLVSLGHRAAPVIRRLEPSVKLLASVASDAKPVTYWLNTSIDDLMGTLQSWTRAIQVADGLSHEFRVSVEVTPELINELKPIILGTSASSRSAAKGSGKSASAGAGAGSGKPGAGTAVSSTATKLTTAAKAAGSGVSATVGKILAGVSGGVSRVTSKLGLTHTTTTSSATSTTSSTGSLSSLLGYLMGGGK